MCFFIFTFEWGTIGVVDKFLYIMDGYRFAVEHRLNSCEVTIDELDFRKEVWRHLCPVESPALTRFFGWTQGIDLYSFSCPIVF